MRHLAIALAVLIAAPAFAQPATNPPQPAPGAQAPATATETEEEFIRRWEREQVIYGHRVLPDLMPVVVTLEDLTAALAAGAGNATPLPPPCEPQPARTVIVPKPPAPCTPQPAMAQPPAADAPSAAQPATDQPKTAESAATKKTFDVEAALDEVFAGIKPCSKPGGCPRSAAQPPRNPASTAAPKPH